MFSTLLTIVLVLADVLVALAVVTVLRRPREPRAMVAWILVLILLPLVGLVLFWLMGEPRIERTRRRRHRRRSQIEHVFHRNARKYWGGHTPAPAAISDELTQLMRVATRISTHPPTRGNQVELLFESEQSFHVVMEAIASARHHVHLEYYIFQPDETGAAVRDLLARKAAEGVQCRVLLDYIGCWSLSGGFLQPMEEAGVEVLFFMPVVPWRGRWRVNFRNHRKIVVVDGQVGFTGSQNIGDEYRGRRTKYGPWRDTQMRIIGPAVQHLQEVFIEDWFFAGGDDLVDEAYFPPVEPASDQIVQVVPSGPDLPCLAMYQLFFAAIGIARRSVRVITPYFVPDTSMIVALQSAAHRGVRVQLMIPSRSDNRWVLWAGRSFYEELIATGVEILEYDHGMLHSKVMIVDESWAMVGSANMDERSFRLNFEVTAILYDAGLAGVLCADFAALESRCRRISGALHGRGSIFESALLGLARMSSPLI